MKKLISIGLAIGCVFIMTGCQTTKNETVKVTEQFFAMDTYITYTVYTQEAEVEATKALIQAANAEFERIADLANRFELVEGVNNVAMINQQAGITPVAVESELLEIVQFAQEITQQSGNAFSVLLGPVSDIWRMYQDGSKTGIPDQTTLDELRPLMNSDQLIVDEAAQTIYLTQAGMVLDLGAIAKGYATEYVSQWLKSQGIEHAIINAGGNVKTIGTHPENTVFRIGLQDPDDLKTVFGSVAIEEQSVVTSGDYQRYFEYEGLRYHHLLDPTTLQPARMYRSVSIITEDSMLADALSTTLFVLSQADGEEFITKYYPDIAVLWYDAQGEIDMNPAMEAIFTLGGE
ncbi:MAG: FAD:protein FMN transferase [Culicoidibacterales bacterium]